MGWTLALMRASLQVIGAHRKLVVFPVVSGVTTIALIVAAGLPVARWGGSPGSWIVIGVGYFLLSLVTVFCNAALVSAANLALRGEEVTIAAGFRGAASRFGAVLGWALISCTVSLLLRALNGVRLGGLVEAVLGLTWQLTTYLVVPLIVVERDSVPRALRRSREMLRRTWGTNLGGAVGISLVLLLAALGGIAVLVGIGALVYVLTHDSTAAFATAGGTSGLWLVVLALLGGTVSAVFRTALYRFATDGSTVAQFRDLDLSTAFD